MKYSHSGNIFDWLLRLGIIAFIASLLFDILRGTEYQSDNWLWFARIISLVFFFIISIIILLLNKKRYLLFGFFFVFIGSLYKILMILAFDKSLSEIPVFFLLICIAVYFYTRTQRNKNVLHR
jgi:hypothetical protein